MKARWVQRIFFLAGGFMLVLSGVAVLLFNMKWLPAGWINYGEASEGAALVALPNMIAMIWAAVAFVLGAFVVRCALVKRTPGTFIVQKSELGELRIAVKAVDNLVRKCVESHHEIHLISTRIVNARDGINIMLDISLAGNVSIPLAVSAIQKQIKQYLMMCSGVDVHEVHVAVENADGAASDSPYLLPDVAEAPKETDAFKDKEQRTLHQRIFGRDAQPVILPPGPQTEEAHVPEADDTAKDEVVASESNESAETAESADPVEHFESADTTEATEINTTESVSLETPDAEAAQAEAAESEPTDPNADNTKTAKTDAPETSE